MVTTPIDDISIILGHIVARAMCYPFKSFNNKFLINISSINLHKFVIVIDFFNFIMFKNSKNMTIIIVPFPSTNK